jgi:GntR family transcriptional regulator
MTLRQAYGVLERQGLIRRRRGIGTFVAAPGLEKSLPDMRSFTEEMVAQGKVASSRLLSLQIREPAAASREFFHLSADEPVYAIRRLRLSDGTPAALESTEVPASLCPQLERFDLASQSLYKILEEHYKMQLGWCDQEVSAELPGKPHRKLLDLRSPDALLVIRRKSYATNGTPVELAVTAYRGSIYRARIHAARVR